MADAGHRDDEPGVVRIDLDALAQQAHIDAQVVDTGPVARDLVQDLIVCQHLAGMRHEQPQDREFGRGQPDLDRAAGDLATDEVDHQIAVAEHWRRSLSLQAVAQRYAQPRRELVDIDRFGDVVAGAAFEGLDLGGHRAGIGQHDDRDVRPTAEMAQQVKPVDVEKAKVEND
jgi:hypothetical protein